MRHEPVEAQLNPPRTVVRFTEAEELARVLVEAERRHVTNDDPQRLAAAVLYLHAKARLLEQVLHAADLYLHSGQGEHEHGALIHAIEHAKEGLRPDLPIGRI
jgi:hypothetical protein